MQRIITLALLLLFSSAAVGQTVIARQDFETTPATPTLNFTGVTPISGTNAAGGRPASANFAFEGSRAWSFNGSATQTATFDNVSLSGFRDVVAQFRLAAFSATSGNGMEVEDVVLVEISTDNGTTYSQELRVTGFGSGGTAGNVVWDYNATGIAETTFDGLNDPVIFAPAGSAVRTTDGFSTVRLLIPDGTSQIRLRITANCNNSNERWCVDDVRITGTPTVSQPPTKLVIASISPASPTVGQPFSITVQAQDNTDAPQAVTSTTTISLARLAGTGTLGGTTTGSISNGQSSTVISGLTYSVAESGVTLQASATSGMSLAAGTSAEFSVSTVVLPTRLVVTVVSPTSPVLNQPFSVTVEAQDGGGTARPVNQATTITLTRASGTGTLGGTTTGSIPNGQTSTVISGLTYNTAQTGVTLTATATSGMSLSSGTSASFNVVSMGSVPQIVIEPTLNSVGLRSALVTQYRPSSVLSYNGARDQMYANIYNVNNKLRCVYTGFEITLNRSSTTPRSDANAGGINCEHTWPQSLGATGQAQSDMHHLFPTRIDANNERSNLRFNDIPDASTNLWRRLAQTLTTIPPSNIDEYSELRTGIEYEPREDHKGNVARAIFYFYTMYESQADDAFFTAQRDVLYRWHYQDPVDSAEYARTFAIAGFQSNRPNPFVLDSTLIRRAYFPSITTANFTGGGTIPAGTYDNITITSNATLGGNVSAIGTVQFNGGNLNTGGFTLNLSTSGQLASENTVPGQYLIGTVSAQRPLSGSTPIDVGGLGVVINPLGNNLGNVSVTRVSGTAGIVTVGSQSGIARRWNISPQFQPSSNVNVQLLWNSADNNSKTGILALWKSNNGGLSWQQVSGADVRASFEAEFMTNSFSDFTVTDADNPLPVELSDFKAQQHERGVELIWTTASEKNNAGFEVQRRTENSVGASWSVLGFVKGKGTTSNAQSYSFVDRTASGKVQYRLKQVDFDGQFEILPTVEVEAGLPRSFELGQNYPNPFNPSTAISYQLPISSKVRLVIYDILGREVATLVNGRQEAGRYSVPFNAASLSSGVYFYRLQASSFVETKKMMLVK